MKTHFDQAWKDWLTTNINNGQNRDGLFKILLDEGFDFNAIAKEMKYLPSVPLEQLVNPFHAAKKQQAHNVQTNVVTAQANQDAQRLEQQKTHFVKISADDIFFANAEKFDSEKLSLHTIGSFLNQDECEQLIANIRNNRFNINENTLEKDIDTRISRLIGMHEAYAEPLQAFTMTPENKSKTAKAAFNVDDTAQFVVIFLNQDLEGGELNFSLINTQLPHKQGAAVICNCILFDETHNPNSQHSFMPVTSGTSYILIKRFKTLSSDKPKVKRWIKEENEFVPNLTKTGFKKSRLPEHLFKKINQFFQDNKNNIIEENVPGDFVFNKSKKNQSSVLVELPEELRHEIHDTLKPICEIWCGKKLLPAYVYGVRIYLNGAVLKPHRDRVETHIIGVIINIDQDVNEDWPLIIEDNAYRKHEVILKPGDVVLYESARLTHGRPIPFNGKSFANAFCHFLPNDYIPKKL